MTERDLQIRDVHDPIAEGAAHDAEGRRIWWYGDRHVGRGRCECGAMSDVLTSNAARQRWHAEHKTEQTEGNPR